MIFAPVLVSGLTLPSRGAWQWQGFVVVSALSGGRLSDVKKLITLLVIHYPSPSVALFKLVL